MKYEKITGNPLLKHCFDLSLALICYCELLNEGRHFVIARQLLRSGTSIGANVIESQNAESRADFIHKMKVAAKEGEETQYWLLLCKYSSAFPDCSDLISRLEEIQKILAVVISRAKRKP